MIKLFPIPQWVSSLETINKLMGWTQTEFNFIENKKILIAQITYHLTYLTNTFRKSFFPNFKPDWRSIYLLPRRVTLDTNLRMFQCKLLMIYSWITYFLGLKKLIPLFTHIATPLHLFHSCLKTKQLWNKFRQYLSQFINILHCTP